MLRAVVFQTMMMARGFIRLPLKILMFILVDGWSLVLKALVGSFH